MKYKENFLAEYGITFKGKTVSVQEKNMKVPLNEK